MKRTAIILAALMCMASRHPDRMIRSDINANVSGNRGDASDRSIYNGTGSLVANAVVTAGNRYFSLDGTDDQISIADHAGLDVGAAFTISAWIEPATPGSSIRYIYGRWNPSGGKRSIQIGADYTSARYFVFIDRTGADSLTAAQLVYYFNATLPSSGWHHVALVYDNAAGTAQRAKLYVNGASVATSSQLNDTSALPLATDVAAGFGGLGGSVAGSNYWKGSIDDCRIYNRTLSAAEVAAIYSSGRE